MKFKLNKVITAFFGIFLLIGALTTHDVQAQHHESHNEPLVDELKTLLKNDSFNIGILLQSKAYFSFKEDHFNHGRSFGLGATRLKINGNVDSGYNYLLQMDFRSSPSVIDAAIGYRASDGFGIKAGLQKPDLGLDLQPNPGKTDFINRARIIGTILNSRELGASASGRIDQFDYTVSIFNGTGRSFSNDDRFMVAAKGAFTIDLEHDASIYIGANGALNGTEEETIGDFNLVTTTNRLIYGAFVDYRSHNWFATAELLMTTFESNQIPDDETITGAYVTVGKHVTEKDRLLARWDYVGYNEVDYSSDLFVLGWTHHATSVIEFKVNALAQFDNNEEYFGVVGEIQFQF